MDPKANLTEQIKLARQIVEGDDLTYEEWDAIRDRLAELVIALYEWRMRGGFDPFDSLTSGFDIEGSELNGL